MPISKLSNLSLTNGRTYSSFLAGNPTYVASSYESIATASGTGSSDTITFSSIPSTFKHLQLRLLVKNSNAGAGNSLGIVRFNSDTAANYAYHLLYGDGTSAAVLAGATVNGIRIAGTDVTSTSGYYGVGVLDILDYASTTKNKTLRGLSGADGNVGGGAFYLGVSSGLWMNTTAITSVSIINSSGSAFTTASTIALYGIKEA